MTGTLTTPSADRHAAQRDAAWEAQSTAAILDLVLKLATAKDAKAGCRMLVEQVPRCLPCQRVAIGMLRAATGRCELITLGGMQELDPRAELPRAIERVLQQAAEQSSQVSYPATDASEVLADVARLADCTGLIASPLRTPGGKTIGAWLVMADASVAQNADHQRFVAAASEALATGLAGLQHQWRLPWPTRSADAPLIRRSRLKFAVTLLVFLAAAAMAIPFDYKITCECQLQPATRRFVAAPFAGVLEKSLVGPGDLVARDQVLGQMDGKEIRWEMASVVAEQQRVGKAHDVNLAAGKVAAAQIDRLEMDRLEQKRQLLEHRAENLQIKSPIDGMLLSGDLKRSEGVPLTVGQRLYEVAPLKQMIVEIVVPDEEVSLVTAGQEVTIRLDAFGGESWQGPIERLHPRSELRENENVFIGEVSLSNEAATLRPGMKGRAKIVAQPQRLGWILFHSAWNRLTNWIAW